MSDGEFISDSNYITYGSEEDGGERIIFIRRCPECMKFVKADEEIEIKGEGVSNEPNAECKVHGRIAMPSLGFI